MFEKIRSNFPSKQESIHVFSVIAFFVFSWALYRMFWYVPSWLGYMSVWKVLALAAYTLSHALIESAFILGLLILISLLLPARVFKEQFIPQGSALAAAICVSSALVQRKIGLIYKLELWQYIGYPMLWFLALLILAFVFAALFNRFEAILRVISAVAERLTILFYIYIFLGVFSLIAVIARNLTP